MGFGEDKPGDLYPRRQRATATSSILFDWNRQFQLFYFARSGSVSEKGVIRASGLKFAKGQSYATRQDRSAISETDPVSGNHSMSCMPWARSWFVSAIKTIRRRFQPIESANATVVTATRQSHHRSPSAASTGAEQRVVNERIVGFQDTDPLPADLPS